MQQLKKNILACLQQLKGSGKFASVHTAGFLFPGLEVEGVGEIAYPINKPQAKALIEAARKAPFGKGSETILDNSVRSAWEINADKLSFNNPEWSNFLNEAISNIKTDLGLEGYTVAAHLYKLLIYEEGDFFLPHKDSEKEKGMFGTLIIGLPSQYTGGELEISFEGIKETAAFAKANANHSINYAAFYADCDHEVKPLTSGYRVCLVYNLIQQKAGKKIELQSLQNHAARLAELFVKDKTSDNGRPYIILLGHQYTPENFSYDALKLNDRAKAEALLLAARQAGHYGKLCLVTSYLAGAPAYSGYEYDEDAVMDEVYNESLYIEHWAGNEPPDLDKVGFGENELIASFPLNDGEPIVKESTGYMGNYGPDLMHWYHYGAVMIWSPQLNAQLLLSQSADTQLNWIDYFNRSQQINEAEITTVECILSTGLTNRDRYEADPKENFNAVVNWLINRKDKDFLLALSGERLQLFFNRIDADHWIKLFGFLHAELTSEVLEKVTEDITVPVLEKLLAVIKAMPEGSGLKTAANKQMALLPGYFKALNTKTQQRINAAALSALSWIVQNLSPEKEWTNAMGEALTTNLQRKYVHTVLVPQLLSEKKQSSLTGILLQRCREYLQQRADNQPQLPADWSRSLPDTTGYEKQWQILKAFLESPAERVFDYRKNQNERNDLERAIQRVVIDLKTETIKKGSPHTLRITKTIDAHKREMKDWHEDVRLLERVKEKGK
ncbi:MAG: 2OG-Fe(II) oxygenase [Chitinophagaceae bacterium]|nr:2OG-Fe(II) oxygenase [Chitinophagaceae bacterium]